VLNIRIGPRILAGYGLSLLLVGAMAVTMHRTLAELVESADHVAHTHQVKEKIAATLAAIGEAESGQRGFVLTGEARYLESHTAGVRTLNTEMGHLRRLTGDNQTQQERLQMLEPVVAAKLNEMMVIIDLRRRAGQEAAAKQILTDKGKTLMDEIRRQATEMDAAESRLLVQRDLRAKTSAEFASRVLVLGGLAILVLVSALGLLIQRSITGPLDAFMSFAGRVGEGDLTQQSKISRGDEIGELGQSLDRMVAGLRDVASQARTATANLTSASAEILASTQQQASSTSEQAAAVQQTTVTMEEVTQSGVQISDRAKQVAASAEATVAASQAGLLAMDRATRTMENIREQAEAVAGNIVSLSEKTQAVGEIIATVNDLAEQSHLLALNAAIEAAAAGEHGRSFSVIASEVKNLADQSREATVQVRGILGEIQRGINSSVMLTEEAVKRVESGRQQGDVASETIRVMADSIQQSVQAFQQIVAGSNQQQIGFSQVTQAVRDIGQASQQTAASTQQLEKAALNLSTLSQQLQRTVERYRL
jgi:methyl-accepting chemotaxis protein